MDKKSLSTISSLIAFEAIPKAKKDEEFEAFVKRAYPEFDKYVQENSNPTIQEMASDMKDELMNAIAKLSARTVIVERFCAVNKPFQLEAPKDATVQEILELNGVAGKEKDLRKIMGDSAFESYISNLKKPKKDGLTQTAIREKREEHYAEFEPVFPSEKEYTHGTGGSTRGYHWQSNLKDAYLSDHKNFVNSFGLEDTLVETKSEEKQEEQESK